MLDHGIDWLRDRLGATGIVGLLGGICLFCCCCCIGSWCYLLRRMKRAEEYASRKPPSAVCAQRRRSRTGPTDFSYGGGNCPQNEASRRRQEEAALAALGAGRISAARPGAPARGPSLPRIPSMSRKKSKGYEFASVAGLHHAADDDGWDHEELPGAERSIFDDRVALPPLPLGARFQAAGGGQQQPEQGGAWLKYYADDGQAYWSNGVDSVWDDNPQEPVRGSTSSQYSHPSTRESRWTAVQQALGTDRDSIVDKTC